MLNIHKYADELDAHAESILEAYAVYKAIPGYEEELSQKFLDLLLFYTKQLLKKHKLSLDYTKEIMQELGTRVQRRSIKSQHLTLRNLIFTDGEKEGLLWAWEPISMLFLHKGISVVKSHREVIAEHPIGEEYWFLGEFYKDRGLIINQVSRNNPEENMASFIEFLYRGGFKSTDMSTIFGITISIGSLLDTYKEHGQEHIPEGNGIHKLSSKGSSGRPITPALDCLRGEYIGDESLRNLVDMTDTLTDIEKSIVKERLGFLSSPKKSLQEVASKMNLSTSRIHQLETSAMRKILKVYRKNFK